MFQRLLIANRGEIACRVIRTCRRLGIASIAVYSDADAGALHVRQADVAVRIGPARAADSYLNAEAILAAARATGADAIHPGYGFLSERLDLIDGCAQAGIAFVGPHRDAIARMDSKIESKRIARAASVVCVPGYDGDDQSAARLREEALRIGVPLLVKASAGGGGKGMRRVDRIDDLDAQLALAKSEALAAFGDDRVLLERYIVRPRHVEVQLLGDRHGNIVHLFERECSIQRNFQKLVEEAPAHRLDGGARTRLFSAALALGKQIGYDSAGTVEFVLDADSNDEPYFLEMNTRLQVEHPVTELTTGIDLVEWQIRAAAGEALAFAQGDIAQRGWAIEARVNAESPQDGFAASFGPVAAYEEPAGEGIRIDSGIDARSVVAAHYDSLVAKVIGHGATREAARMRLAEGLRGLRIAGLRTTQPLLLDVLRAPGFQEVLTTNFLPAHWPDGWRPADATLEDAARLAAAAHWIDEALPAAGASDTPMASLTGWRVTAPVTGPGRCLLDVRDADGSVPLEVRLTPGAVRVQVEGSELALVREQPGLWRDAATGRGFTTAPDGRDTLVWSQGWSGRFTVTLQVAADPHDTAGVDTGDAVVAEMPGVLAQLLVAAGDTVEQGAPVAVLEAMKLFHTLVAPRAGVVAALPVALGATVGRGAVLAQLEPLTPPA